MRAETTFGPSALVTPANAVTVARVALTPLLLAAILLGGPSWPALALWIGLASTDGVDGFLARRHGTTRSGAFLDPLADKLLVLGGFLALAARSDIAWIAFAIVAVREIGISLYRSLAGRRGISLPARQLGKWKTVLQLLAVGVVVFPLTENLSAVHHVAVWTAVALTVLSALDMLRRGWQEAQTAP